MNYPPPSGLNGSMYLSHNNGLTGHGLAVNHAGFAPEYVIHPVVPAAYADQRQSMAAPGLGVGLGSTVQATTFEARQKEALRRRQSEYSQALEEQIRAKEQQKKLEKEAERRQQLAPPPNNNTAMPPSPPKPRGLFDGLGQREQTMRTNFARGQHGPPQSAFEMPPPTMQPMMMPQQLAPSVASNYQGNDRFPPMLDNNNNNMLPALQVPQYQPTLAVGSNPMGPSDTFSPRANGLPPAHGRRIRTDINGAADQLEETRRQEQHQKQREMQQFLMNQIEAKKRANDLAKRQEEERERKEMEQLQREQAKQEQEEKLRKLQKKQQEEAQLRMIQEQQQQQQQAQAQKQKQREYELAQQELQRQQQVSNDHDQSAPESFDAPMPRPRPRQQTQPPHRDDENPFVNRKDNLFQEPPAQPSQEPPISQVFRRQRHHEGYASTSKSPFANTKEDLFQEPPPSSFEPFVPVPPPQYQHLPSFAGPPQPSTQAFYPIPSRVQHQASFPDPRRQQSFGGGPVPQTDEMDPLELKRQYQAMKDELARQRELVVQLRKQQVVQQQQQTMQPAISSPTLADFDQLRNELKAELQQREDLHRQEIEQLRRQQDEDKMQLLHLSRQTELLTSPKRESTDDEPIRQSSHRQRQQREQRAMATDAATSMSMDALDSSAGSPTLHQPSHRPNNRTSDSNQCSSPLISTPCPLVASSLSCDSKFVYFDGKVHAPPAALAPEPESRTSVEMEDSLDKLTLSTKAAPSISAKTQQPSISHREPNHSQQSVSLTSIQSPVSRQVKTNKTNNCSNTNNNQEESAEDRTGPNASYEGDGDSLSFFVRDFSSALPHSSDGGRSSDQSLGTPLQQNAAVLQDSSPSAATSTTSLLDDMNLNSLEDIQQVLRRNMRRHEILVQFETRHRPQLNPQHNNWMADATDPTSNPTLLQQTKHRNEWTELHQLLRRVRAENQGSNGLGGSGVPEESLVGSSRWMPSPSKRSFRS